MKMKFFIDTANLDMIKEINSWGILDGVTTNPSLVAKEGTDTPTRVAEIAKILGDRPVSAEAMAVDAEGMIAEGKKLAAIAPNVNVKLPMCIESLKATKALSEIGIDVNMTLIFSPLQALMAAKAGARYVSPFVGRLDDIGTHGNDMLTETVGILRTYGFETEVIAASIRHPVHVLDAAEMGCDIATIPYDILKKMVSHPKTDEGIAKFKADYEKVNGSQ
ncbi:transaldolase [Thermoplasmatales archaeon BRNA1]|nr:transaldolase [Thermoplasmatales archaeon BRNA1]